MVGGEVYATVSGPPSINVRTSTIPVLGYANLYLVNVPAEIHSGAVLALSVDFYGQRQDLLAQLHFFL